MAGTKKLRIALDIMLTAMIVFEMFIQYTGEFLHEVVGFAFFATVVLHLAISAKWMQSTAKAAKSGKMSARRGALAVMGILLAATMVVLGVSSVAISGLLASAGFVWTLGSYEMWTTVHAVSSYVLCALVTMHLAMHWAFLASVLKVPYDPSRRRAIGMGVHAAAAVGALALGVLAVGEAMPKTTGAAATEGNSASSGNSDRNGFEGPVDDRPSSSRSSKAPSSIAQDDAPASRGDDSSADSGSGQDSSSAEGICTLCRKRCPLSAPRCDKPYEAGLI